MLTVNLDQRPQVIDKRLPYAPLSLEFEIQPDLKLYELLADLSPDTSWGDRKIATQKLGNMRNPEALPRLLVTLQTDSFWMVRCAIIQALEKIGDPDAVPALQKAADNDGFQVVRSHAVKAIERLSR
jgi:HEAT repeat protein